MPVHEGLRMGKEGQKEGCKGEGEEGGQIEDRGRGERREREIGGKKVTVSEEGWGEESVSVMRGEGTGADRVHPRQLSKIGGKDEGVEIGPASEVRGLIW